MAEKLLIIDDDLDTLKLVGLILQRHGYTIVAANGGNAGLAKAVAERPDLILLDLMMPDMDGYEVTRRLRSDPSLAHIPIIMFTAKTMLDDKVAGFEAGADDYLTKPTHPTELITHVKALLARVQGRRTAAAAAQTAYTVGLIGSKGGVGTTTLAINLAALATQAGHEVILADLHLGSGALGLMLGLTPPQGLAALLAHPPAEINQRTVGGQLLPHTAGMRVLAGLPLPGEASLGVNAPQGEAVMQGLSCMCKVLVLDLGASLTELARRVLPLCQTVVVVSDITRVGMLQTKALLNDLGLLGLTSSRLALTLVNRVPASTQLAWQQIEQTLGHKVVVVITPAAELAYQASEAGLPLALMQADSLSAEQIHTLATHVFQKVRAPA